MENTIQMEPVIVLLVAQSVQNVLGLQLRVPNVLAPLIQRLPPIVDVKTDSTMLELIIVKLVMPNVPPALAQPINVSFVQPQMLQPLQIVFV
jgi:hypothetical protein